MKKHLLISLCLLFSLFIYLFYRTEDTVVNNIFLSLISFDFFVELRNNIKNALPLNEYIIYSLPEGLWVFCITLTSRFLFFKIGKHEISLLYLPLVFAIGLELFQLFHFSNGYFDFWDIGASILFWAIAAYLMPFVNKRQNILNPLNLNSLICIISYLIVYLAHVWK